MIFFFPKKPLKDTKSPRYKKVSADHHNLWKTQKTTWNSVNLTKHHKRHLQYAQAGQFKHNLLTHTQYIFPCQPTSSSSLSSFVFSNFKLNSYIEAESVPFKWTFTFYFWVCSFLHNRTTRSQMVRSPESLLFIQKC